MRGSAPLPRPRPLRRHTYSERANHTRPAPDVDRLCPPRPKPPAWIGDTNPALKHPTRTGGTALDSSPHGDRRHQPRSQAPHADRSTALNSSPDAHRRTRPRPTHRTRTGGTHPALKRPTQTAVPHWAQAPTRTGVPAPTHTPTRTGGTNPTLKCPTGTGGTRPAHSLAPAQRLAVALVTGGRWWRAHSSPHRDRRNRTGFKPPRASAYPPPPPPPHGPAVPTPRSSAPPGPANPAPHSLPPRRPRALAGDQFRERYLDRAR